MSLRTKVIYSDNTKKIDILVKKYARAVRKVSSHFEYPENRSRGLHVIWHPAREGLTVYPITVTLPWG